MFPKHRGCHYTEFLATLVQKRSCRTYLEIGVSKGVNLSRIECEVVVGVDTCYDIDVNIVKGKSQVHLYQCPSDVFFQTIDMQRIAPGGVDFVFLDGMHLFEFLLRDFYKTECICHRRSLVAMHDCLPLNLEMTERSRNPAARRDKEFADWWTGDVWKLVPILKKWRPDLVVSAVNCPPTGLVLVSNLDPASSLLEDKYAEIMREYRALADEGAALNDMYTSLDIVDAREILKDCDHSLYFKV
jgi:hypothetical protein